MLKKIKKFFMAGRAKKIAGFIYPYLSDKDEVLDFGCGDMIISYFIQKNIDVKIKGIDVIDTNLTSLPLQIYDGKSIPFEDKSFDATCASFVLHHTDNIESLLSECIRVTKRRIIILEDVYQTNLELFMVKLFDYGNKLLSLEMDIPFNFKKESEWIELFNKLNVKNIKTKKIYPHFLKLTKHRLFILDLK